MCPAPTAGHSVTGVRPTARKKSASSLGGRVQAEGRRSGHEDMAWWQGKGKPQLRTPVLTVGVASIPKPLFRSRRGDFVQSRTMRRADLLDETPKGESRRREAGKTKAGESGEVVGTSTLLLTLCQFHACLARPHTLPSSVLDAFTAVTPAGSQAAPFESEAARCEEL